MRWVRIIFISFLLLEFQSCSKKTIESLDNSHVRYAVKDSSVTQNLLDNNYGMSNSQKYHYSIHYLRGTAHHGTWSLGFYQLDNGNNRVRDIFNSSSLASAQSQLKEYMQGEGQEFPWDFIVKPSIIFTPHTINEVLSGVIFFHKVAHPTLTISTVVVDVRTARKLRLSDIFLNEDQGLRALSSLVRYEFTKKYHIDPGTLGLEPQESNFAHWVSTRDGFRVIFEDLQSGHGQPDMTVPWEKINSYLKPEMRDLGK